MCLLYEHTWEMNITYLELENKEAWFRRSIGIRSMCVCLLNSEFDSALNNKNEMSQCP